MESVTFTAMEDGTAADYQLLDRHERIFAAGLADRVIAALKRLDGSMGGHQVSRLTHSLQTATRAAADGADDDLITAALIHDLGDELAPYNHAELAAAIIRPYVRPEVTWIVEQHGLVQSYYYAHHLGGDRHARQRIADHPWYTACVDFCARWDQASFDPAYPTRELGYFEPVLRRVFGREAYDPRYRQT
jgi:predicted HD phosphohydrolase